jgi:hypothetical protein
MKKVQTEQDAVSTQVLGVTVVQVPVFRDASHLSFSFNSLVSVSSHSCLTPLLQPQKVPASATTPDKANAVPAADSKV